MLPPEATRSARETLFQITAFRLPEAVFYGLLLRPAGNTRACLITPRGADFIEFSFMARNFREGVPGVRQAEVTKPGAKGK
ncbi:hypothetical protein D3C78_1753930 [compost metagenome]